MSDEKTEVIKVRLTPTLRERCNLARLAGAHDATPESTFLGYLIKVGVGRYEKHILPIEKGELPNGSNDLGGRKAAAGE